MSIQSVGVVGAGQMGNGIAHVFALAGYDVLLTDVSQDALDKAMELIDRNLERQASREKISAQRSTTRRWPASRPRLTLTDLGPSDLIIEAATERETVKQAIFEDLLPHLKPSHDPDVQHLVDLDHAAGQPDRPAGKVHGLSLHEPGAGDAAGGTDPRHRHRRCHLPDHDRKCGGKAGKGARRVPRTFPAFIVNRILMPMINEAVYTLYEGVGNVSGPSTSR
jgi:3-hydroxybutyryl-CoA dehydrogenase